MRSTECLLVVSVLIRSMSFSFWFGLVIRICYMALDP